MYATAYRRYPLIHCMPKNIHMSWHFKFIKSFHISPSKINLIRTCIFFQVKKCPGPGHPAASCGQWRPVVPLKCQHQGILSFLKQHYYDMKVTWCLSVRRIWFSLYNKASFRSREVLQLFWRWLPTPLEELFTSP